MILSVSLLSSGILTVVVGIWDLLKLVYLFQTCLSMTGDTMIPGAHKYIFPCGTESGRCPPFPRDILTAEGRP